MRSRSNLARLAVLATGLCLAILVPAAAAAPPATTTPTVDFTLLTDLPTQLTVGETYTIEVLVESSEPFLMAIALSDAYFPGRSVRFDGSSAEAKSTSTVLTLTLTATGSTADLPAALGWPVEGVDWEAGTAPLAVRAGVRFPGGKVVSAGWYWGLTVS